MSIEVRHCPIHGVHDTCMALAERQQTSERRNRPPSRPVETGVPNNGASALRAMRELAADADREWFRPLRLHIEQAIGSLSENPPGLPQARAMLRAAITRLSALIDAARSDTEPSEPTPSREADAWLVNALLHRLNHAEHALREGFHGLVGDSLREMREVLEAAPSETSERLLREDSERLDWLERTRAAVEPLEGNIMPPGSWVVIGPDAENDDDVDMAPSLREAIDAARLARKEAPR